MFIAFDGIDGSGKTTQVQLLAENLKSEGFNVLVTKEPGSPHNDICIKIRELILSDPQSSLAELYLFLSDREEHLKRVVLPALQDGKIVICDRYVASTYAYQLETCKEAGIGDHYLINPLIIPDLYLWMKLDATVSRERVIARKQDNNRFDNRSILDYMKTIHNFEHFFDEYKFPYVSVDASLSQEQIAQEIKTFVLSLFTKCSSKAITLHNISLKGYLK